MIKLKNILIEQITTDSEFRQEIKDIEGPPAENKSGNYIAFDDKMHKYPVWTIGWGHTEDVKEGDVITPSKAEQLLTNDIAIKVKTAKRKFPKYDSFDIQIKRAIVNALYRGGLGPNAEKLINTEPTDWNAVADEYLDSDEFRREKQKTMQRRNLKGTKKLAQPDTNIFTRMSKNADRFRTGAKQTKKVAQRASNVISKYLKGNNIYTVKDGDTLSSIAANIKDVSITIQTIAAANNIDLNNPIITPGQKLIIK